MESFFQNPLLKDWTFVRSGSCERGIFARLVSLDSALGIYVLLSLSTDLASYLFYCTGFGFYPFCCQVGHSHFLVLVLFQVFFFVVVSLEVENQYSSLFLFVGFVKFVKYEHFPSFWDGGLGFCAVMLAIFAYNV